MSLEAALERKQLRALWKEYKLPLTCARFLIIYLVFLFIAKYSSVFMTGFMPNNLFSTTIVVFVLFYRLLCIAVAPAILVVWLSEIVLQRHFNLNKCE
jgi:hypothetical protein